MTSIGYNDYSDNNNNNIELPGDFSPGANDLPDEVVIETKSWLDEGHPLGGLDANIDGFALLERFAGKNVKADGADALNDFAKFLGELKENDAFGLDKDKLDDLSKSMKQVSDLAEEMKGLSGREEIKAFAETLKDRLTEEKILLIPVLKEGGKIATIVRVDKDHGFSIINVEASDPYNLREQTKRDGHIKHTHVHPLTGEVIEELKARQFHSFSTRNKERIGDVPFFETLIKGSDLDSQSLDKMLFKSLPKYIQGKKVSVSSKQPELFKKGLRHGDHSTKNISTVLYYLCMNPFFKVAKDNTEAVTTYKTIKFLWQSQAFMHCIKNADEWNDEERKLLTDVMHNLVRSADKLNRREGISHEHLSGFFKACEEAKVLLKPPMPETPVSKEDSFAKKNIPRMIKMAGPMTPPLDFRVPQSINDGRVYNYNDRDRDPVKQDKLAKKLMGELIQPFSVATAKEFEESVTRIKTILHGIKCVSRSEREPLTNTRFEVLGDIVLALPIPVRGDAGYWNGLNEDEAKAFYEQLERLSTVIFEVTGFRHTPECSVMVYALYAIQLKLATRLTDLDEGDFNYRDLMLEMRSPNFMVSHPGIQKMIHPLMRFFDPNWNVEELSRKVTKKDLSEEVSSLLGFKRSDDGGVTTQWSFELDPKSKKQSSTQKFLAKLLKDEDRLNSVKEIIVQVNEKADKDHETAIEQYNRDTKVYIKEKAHLEGVIAKVQGRIDKLKEEKQSRLEEITQGLSENERKAFLAIMRMQNLSWYQRDDAEIARLKEQILSTNIDQLVNNYKKIEQEFDRQIEREKDSLSRFQFELEELVKPVEPKHKGYYPVDSEVDQIGVLLTQEEGVKLVPDAVKQVIQASLKTQYYLAKGVPDEELEFTAYNWNPLPKDKQDSRKTLQFGLKKVGAEYYYEHSNRSGLLVKASKPEGSYRERDVFKDIVHDHTYHKITPNIVMASNKKMFGLDVGQTRELRMLGIDPFDTVTRTLTFFGSHVALLEKPAVQKLIRFHLFRPERIHSQVRDNPKVADVMSKFITNSLKHFVEMGDIDTSLYLVRLGNELKELMVEMDVEHSFPDYRKTVLEELIPTLGGNRKEELKAYFTLVILHANKKVVTEEIMKDLLAARVSMSLQKDIIRFSKEDQALFDSVLLRFGSTDLNKKSMDLNKKSMDEIINHAVSVADGEKTLEWEHKHPVYTSGKYQINVDSGVVTVDGSPMINTPNWITNNRVLQKVYPYSISENGCKEEGKDKCNYVLNPGTDHQVSIYSYNRGRTIEIKRVIDGTEYRYIETPRTLSRAHSTIFNDELHCWVDDKDNILVRKGEKNVYRIIDKKIIRESDKAVLLEIASAVVELQDFEKDENFIECWLIGNESVINLKRLGLSFTTKEGNPSLICQQFPGYAIADPASLNTFKEKVPMITLVNASGETKVLIPKMMDKKSVEEPMQWFAYDVVDNDIVPANVEQQIYKMMMLAKQGEYLKVKEMMDHLNALELFSELDLKMIQMIGGFLVAKQDPEANALFLRLVLLVEVNRLKFPGVEDVDSLFADDLKLALILQSYQFYLKELGNHTTFRLSEENERQLLDILYARVKDYATKLEESKGEDDNYGEGFLKKAMKKLVGDEDEIKLMGMLAMFEQRLGHRFDFLSTKKGKMGVRPVKILNVEAMADEMDGPDGSVDCIPLFLQHLGGGDALIVPTAEDIKTALETFDKDEGFWKENFVTLYYAARSGTKAEKTLLRQELDLTEHHASSFRAIIRSVSNWPGRFTTFGSLNKQIHKWKVGAPAKIRVAEEKFDEATKKKYEAEGEEDEIRDELWKHQRSKEKFSTYDYCCYSQAQAHFEKKLKKMDADHKDRADFENRVEKLKSLNKQIKVKKAEVAKAAKVTKSAVAYQDKMRKALEKAEDYKIKMGASLEKKIKRISPNKIILMITTYAKVIFNVLKFTFQIKRLKKAFLNKHIYPVRDIFSKDTLGEKREKLAFANEDLIKIDEEINTYLKDLVSNKIQSDRENTEWNPSNGHSDVVTQKLTEEKAWLEEYQAKNKDIRTASLIPFDFKRVKKSLGGKSQELSTSLVAKKEKLLKDLNNIIREDKEANLKFAVNRFGKKGELSWENLRQLSMAGDLKSFLEKTGLDKEAAQKVMYNIAEYLVVATRVEQIRFLIGLIEKAVKESDQERVETYSHVIGAALQMKRHYTPDATNISRLWFEHANMYMYRKNQIEKLAELGENDKLELLAEMPTGFGKTKNLIPTLDHDKSNENLVFNVHPKTIEHINSGDIRDQMNKSFGKKADRFHFQRSTKFTLESLRKLYEEMQRDFEQGRPINLSSETLRALELHFILTLHTYHEVAKTNGVADDTKIKEEIGYFIRILRAVRVHGWATIDEAHVNLDPNDKLIYTIGKSHTLPITQLNILEEIFEQLTQNKLIKVSTNQQAELTSEEYAEVAKNLADHFAAFFKIKDENAAEFNKFVLGNLDTIPNWIEKHHRREEIALVKGQLSYVLKSCLKGYVDENFGLSKMHLDSKEYAISYSSANTPKENAHNPSQFKNPHETMNKTYLTYLHKGLSETQVVKLIKLLQAEQLEEFHRNVPMGDTKAYKLFSSICPEKRLKNMTEKEMKEIASHFRKNTKAIFYYIKHIIAPQLKLYEENLVSTPQNFRSQFASSLSVTATPQDKATHGPDTGMVAMEGTQGQVTQLFLQTKKIHVTESSEPEPFLKDVLDVLKKNRHINAIIDVGAQFRGLSNELVANEIRGKFEGNDKVEAIQYFDVAKEKFVFMEAKTGEVLDPAMVSIDPRNVITFYDQPRCFGSDLKLDKNAVGLLLVSKTTKKSTAGQGAGRMREWHLEQKVEVMVTGEKEMTSGDLLEHWVSNDANDRATKNYYSQMQQMDNEIRRVLLDRMIGLKLGKKPTIEDKTPDVSKAIKLFGKYESELVDIDSSDPWVLYSAMPTEQKSVGVLKEHHNKCMDRAKKLGSSFSASSKKIRKRLENFPQKWEGEDAIPLPEKVKATAPGLGMECEVLQEVEVEEQVEQQIQMWSHHDKRIPSKWSDSMNLFRAGWEKPRAHRSFYKKLANKFSKIEPRRPVLKILFRAGLIVLGTALAATAAAVAGIALPIVGGVAAGIALVGVGIMVWRYFATRNIRVLSNHTYKAQDVIGASLPRSLKRAKRFFSPNLLASNNYYAQETGNWKQLPVKPFGQEQKPLFQVLVIKDKASLKMMLIDQNDSQYFHAKLQKDYESDKEVQRTRKIALYDINNDIISVQGNNKFADEELQNDEFRELIVQAKLINGVVKYTNDEIDYLKKRNKEIGNEMISKLIEQCALSEHPSKKVAFATSDLAERIA